MESQQQMLCYKAKAEAAIYRGKRAIRDDIFEAASPRPPPFFCCGQPIVLALFSE